MGVLLRYCIDAIALHLVGYLQDRAVAAAIAADCFWLQTSSQPVCNAHCSVPCIAHLSWQPHSCDWGRSCIVALSSMPWHSCALISGRRLLDAGGAGTAGVDASPFRSICVGRNLLLDKSPCNLF